MSAGPPEVTTASPRLRLEDLAGLRPSARHPGRNRTKGEIAVYDLAPGRLAVKDYSARPWWIKNTLGRWLIRREASNYAAAGALAGLPRFAGRLGPHTLAVEWVAGRPLAAFSDGSVPAARFDALLAIVRALHDRGIAHADLNHRDVLLGDDGSVHVVDLASAWRLGRRPGPLRRRVFERLRAADLFAVARLRARFAGEELAAVLATADPAALAWHRRMRRIKWSWDRLRGAERLPPIHDHWRR